MKYLNNMIKSIILKILNIAKEKGYSPEKINRGNCEWFAYQVWKLAKKLPAIWTEDNIGHTFIEYEGKFYDAETPNGVDAPNKLSIMGNKYDKNFTHKENFNKLIPKFWK